MRHDNRKQLSKLENLYNAGMEMRKLGRNRKRWVELAKRVGIRHTQLRVAEEFAIQYSPEEFAELTRQRRFDGTPLDIEYVPLLLTLPWLKEHQRLLRSLFQQEIVIQGWSVNEVRSEIERRGLNVNPNKVVWEILIELYGLLDRAEEAGMYSPYSAEVLVAANHLVNCLRQDMARIHSPRLVGANWRK